LAIAEGQVASLNEKVSQAEVSEDYLSCNSSVVSECRRTPYQGRLL
jgi:hypothetical protein